MSNFVLFTRFYFDYLTTIHNLIENIIILLTTSDDKSIQKSYVLDLSEFSQQDSNLAVNTISSYENLQPGPKSVITLQSIPKTKSVN